MWKYISQIATFDCSWIKLVGEKWEDNNANVLEYWRVVTEDSLIVIPIQQDQFLLPNKTFRPGVGFKTLDFPGGRLSKNRQPEKVAEEILKRELGIPAQGITQLISIYEKPKLVNSSTSNQKLFGFYAVIDSLPESVLLPHYRFSSDHGGINELLQKLDCLQCRALLLEFLRLFRISRGRSHASVLT